MGRPARSQAMREAVTPGDRRLEVPGHGVDLDPSGDREVVLFAVAGEPGERVGVVGGLGEVAGGKVDFGGHQQVVVELEPGRRVEGQRARAPRRDGRASRAPWPGRRA